MQTLDNAATVGAISLGNGNEPKSAGPTWLSILDAVRGSAALYVVCNHAFVLLLIGFRQARAMEMPLAVQLMAALSYLFAFGHQAVILFFVLSGFCIHFRQAQRLHDGVPGGSVFQPKSYFVRRFRRIVPPYYFAILFTAVVDWLIRGLDPVFVAPRTGNFLADNILVQHNDLHTLVGNLLFLQWLKYPTWGNDTPLWSLAYEFGLYLLYPLFWFLRLRAGLRGSVVAVAGVSLAAMFCMTRMPHSPLWMMPVFAYWFIWVMGAWTAEVYVGGGHAQGGFWLRPGVLLALGAAWLASIRVLPAVVSDTFGAGVCALTLLAVLDCCGRRPDGPIGGTFLALMGPVGVFSYSLYLIHVPVLSLICCLWLLTHDGLPTNPFLCLVGIVSALVVGWLVFQYVERRFTNHP